MNNYLNILEQKQKMYTDILGRDKLVADEVVIAFPDIEAGWFDASVVVNGVEEYMISFSDINKDIYEFVDWLRRCACYDYTHESVYIDCEFEQLTFTIEKLPTEYNRISYASLGLLWWFDDNAKEKRIQYGVINIAEFVAKTYMALLHASISNRFEILAWWQDEYMREDEEMSKSEYDGYEFLELKDKPELVSNRLQLLFYNKIRNRDLDELAFETSFKNRYSQESEVENVVFIRTINGQYKLHDINCRDYTDVLLPLPSGNIISDAIRIRETLPENISLFCSDYIIKVIHRASDVKDQTPYEQAVPILIPYGAKKLNVNL